MARGACPEDYRAPAPYSIRLVPVFDFVFDPVFEPVFDSYLSVFDSALDSGFAGEIRIQYQRLTPGRELSRHSAIQVNVRQVRGLRPASAAHFQIHVVRGSIHVLIWEKKR
jgi:hypothetical protein